MSDKNTFFCNMQKCAADTERLIKDVEIGKQMLSTLMVEYERLRYENDRLRNTEKFLRSERPIARSLTKLENENKELKSKLSEMESIGRINAFVTGGKYWQYISNGSTLFPSEIDILEKEAYVIYKNI